MALNHYRSSLQPEVEFGGDGTVFVTSRDGTFPLTTKPNQTPKPDNDPKVIHESYNNQKYKYNDSTRSHRTRYRQRGPTINQQSISPGNSMATSSLIRRLRRNHTLRSIQGSISPENSISARSIDRHSSHKSSSKAKKKKSSGNVGGSSSARRLGGTPRMPPEFAASLELHQHSSSDSAKSSHLNGNSSRGNSSVFNGLSTREGRLVLDLQTKRRTISEEKLPYLIFLVVGCLLIIIGILRLIVSYWHEYGNGVWTGSLILALGIVGKFHERNYFSEVKNGLYILFGVLSSIFVLVASAFTLSVLIPMLDAYVSSSNSTLVYENALASVSFSNNNNRTLPNLSISPEADIPLTIVLDFITLLLLAICLYAQTATVIAIDNYWSTNYYCTGDCNHRGMPRYFNPVEQLTVGQITVFVGLVQTIMLTHFQTESERTVFDTPDNQYGWIMVWNGIIIIIAGLISTCFGKRKDKLILGIAAIIGEIIGLLVCTVATVFTTMSLAGYVSSQPVIGQMVFIDVIYNIVMIVNLVFIVGIVFRQFQQLCCHKPNDSQQQFSDL